MKRFVALAAVSLLVSCGDDDSSGKGRTGIPGGGGSGSGVAILGGGSHNASSLSVVEIANASDGLNLPRDLAFHPTRTDELWIVNRADHSTVVVFDPDSANQSSQKYASFGNRHFLAQPSSLAFADSGDFATCHEEDDLTQGPVSAGGTPADFMGPTLWTSNLSIFDGGHGGHLDMLHNSPNAMGIAWERDNIFWVFDGYHSSVTRYDFKADHGPGGAYHGDGIVARFVEDEVSRVADVPSHMSFMPGTTDLVIADTGNNRIAVLDTNSGQRGGNTFPNYDGSDQYRVDNASITTLVDGSTVANFSQPSGLEIYQDTIFVTDSLTGFIFAFDLQGQLLDWLDTQLPAGSLMGISFDSEGSLFMVDALSDKIWKFSQ